MTAILIIGIVIAIIWILVILIQNPKGGGLASNFSQGNQIFGVERTTDVVEKITWGGFIVIVAICFASVAFAPKAPKAGQQQKTKAQTEKSGDALPSLPK